MVTTPAYLTPADLQAAFTATQGQGVDFTALTTPQLTSIIGQASTKIDRHCRDTAMLTRVTEDLRGSGTNELQLLHYPIWGGLVTTLSGGAASGDRQLILTDVTGLLPGQLLSIADALEPPARIAAAYVAGTLIVPLVSPLAAAHAVGAAVLAQGVDTIELVVPNLGYVPVQVPTLVVEGRYGVVRNYTLFYIQMAGYTDLFPRDVPLRVTYTYGYPPGQYPAVLQQTCLELCVSTVLRAATRQGGGVQSQRSLDEGVSYFSPQVPELTPDQRAGLAPFSRRGGMH